MSTKKKIASFALFVIAMIVATAVIIAMTASNAKAEEKPEQELPTVQLRNESHRIYCYDTAPGACQESMELLERLQELRRKKRNEREYQRQIATPRENLWIDI